MRRASFLIPLWAILLSGTFLLAREFTLLPDGKTHVHFLDVGQGDSTLIVSPSGKAALIDGGPDLSTLASLGKHLPFGKRTIDLLVLSHPHEDHLASLPEILRRYKVLALLLPETSDGEGRFQELLSLAKEQRVPLLFADSSQDLDFGDGLLLDVLSSPPRLGTTETAGAESSGTNNTSVVLVALSGSSSVLFTGDIEHEAEYALFASGEKLSATILKVPHHGSQVSDSLEFFSSVRPKISIISAGRENPYGHPSPSTVEHLRALGSDVLETSKEGTISLTLQ